MGLVLRKSFRLPGGFRLNLSKSGVGISDGVPGFRVGIGPSGTRVTAGIPGTGIGWVQSFGRGAPEKARPAKAISDAAPSGHDREVAKYDERVAELLALHRAVPRSWDWAAVAATPAPPSPTAGASASSVQEAQVAHERWAWLNNLAHGILAGDPAACEAGAAPLFRQRNLIVPLELFPQRKLVVALEEAAPW